MDREQVFGILLALIVLALYAAGIYLAAKWILMAFHTSSTELFPFYG